MNMLQANKLEGYLRSGKPIQDAGSVENCRREHLQAGSSALREAFGHDQMLRQDFRHMMLVMTL